MGSYFQLEFNLYFVLLEIGSFKKILFYSEVSRSKVFNFLEAQNWQGLSVDKLVDGERKLYEDGNFSKYCEVFTHVFHRFAHLADDI